MGSTHTANNSDIALCLTRMILLDSLLCCAHKSIFPLVLCLALRAIIGFGAHDVTPTALVRVSTRSSCIKKRGNAESKFLFHFPLHRRIDRSLLGENFISVLMPHRRSRVPPTGPRRYISVNILAQVWRYTKHIAQLKVQLYRQCTMNMKSQGFFHCNIS